MIGTGVYIDRPTLRASMAQGLFLGGTGRRAVAHTRPEFPKMPTAPSAFPLLGAPQAPGNKPNLPEGSKSLGRRPPEAVGNPQAPGHTLPEPRPDNTASQCATQHLERSSLKSICHQNDRDRSLLVLELLPYVVDGLAHYAEKVGDTQHLYIYTHTHTHTHTYIYIYIYIWLQIRFQFYKDALLHSWEKTKNNFWSRCYFTL